MLTGPLQQTCVRFLADNCFSKLESLDCSSMLLSRLTCRTKLCSWERY